MSDDWHQATASLSDTLHSASSPLPVSVVRVFITTLSNEQHEADVFSEVLTPISSPSQNYSVICALTENLVN